jgi:hypothetical protein
LAEAYADFTSQAARQKEFAGPQKAYHTGYRGERKAA